MVIYVAGYPAIMGLQPLYFKDAELARRGRIPAESAQTKQLGDMLANASVGDRSGDFNPTSAFWIFLEPFLR